MTWKCYYVSYLMVYSSCECIDKYNYIFLLTFFTIDISVTIQHNIPFIC